MEYTFAKPIQNLAPSAIREILKFTGMPDVISFAAGNPAPEAFPREDIARLSADLFARDATLALQYNITEGYTRLRDILKERLTADSLYRPESDDLIITSGAQQVNELSCKVLLNAGDTLLCESPSFIGSLNAFRSYGVNLIGVDMENDGMDMTMLEDKIRQCPRVKLVYVIPNFQNPTGRVMSLEKRKKIYALACEYNFLILEDNPYGNLRFDGDDIPSIKSFDTEGRVIYAGTFSKILSPGMRVGYVSAPAPIVSKMTVCKQVADVHTNIWAQVLCADWLEQTDMPRYLNHLQEIYRHKCGLMADGIRAHFSPSITWEMPQGGLFIWCTLPKEINMLDFCQTAVEKYRIAVVPGTSFLTDETAPSQSIRLNFSTPPDDEIVKGIEILGALTRELLS